MSKENSLLFFMVVVTIAVMFTATKVMAQTCADTYTVTSEANKYELKAVPCGDEGTFPCREDVAGEIWYKYEYELDNIEVDHIYLTIPYRPDDPIRINENQPSAIGYLAPGVGAGGVGEGEFNVRVIDLPPTTVRVYYLADRPVRGGTSVYFAKGKFTYEGTNCISGVGYEAGGVFIGSSVEYEALQANSPSICVREHLGPDGCVEQLDYACYDPDDDDEDCPGSITSTDWMPVLSEEVVADYIGASGFDQKCPGSWDIRDLQAAATDLCGDTSTASFMDFLDFLGPSPAYAATCSKGCCLSRYSRGKLYCLQCCP